MKNSVTERIPYDWYEIDAIEGWLDEHVRHGLRLVSISPMKRALFVPSTGSITRYRIHVKEEKDGSRDEEYRETFRELGWEFIAELNDQADVYQAVRPDAVEINTDEDVLRSVIDKVLNRQRIMLIVCVLLLPFWGYLKIKGYTSGFYNGILDHLMSNPIIPLTDFFLLSVWVVLIIAGFKRLRNMKKRRLLQRDYHTPSEAKRRKRPLIYALTVYISLWCVLLFLVVFYNGKSPRQVEEPPCPVVGLSAINYEESSPDAEISIWDHHGEYGLYRYSTYRWDAPHISMPAGWQYSPYRYVVGVNEIKIAALTTPYLREALAAEDDVPWQQVDISGWDEAWYQSYERTREEELAWVGHEFEGIEALPSFRQQYLYLRDGSTIIHIDYTGSTDLYPRLQELYGK